jgi:hypothetical protein
MVQTNLSDVLIYGNEVNDVWIGQYDDSSAFYIYTASVDAGNYYLNVTTKGKYNFKA